MTMEKKENNVNGAARVGRGQSRKPPVKAAFLIAE